MSSHDPEISSLAERIEDLEVRYAYLERLLSDLDGVVRDTADELARVGRVVTQLRQRAEQEGEEVQSYGLQEEKPPHY